MKEISGGFIIPVQLDVTTKLPIQLYVIMLMPTQPTAMLNTNPQHQIHWTRQHNFKTHKMFNLLQAQGWKGGSICCKHRGEKDLLFYS
jgi:hypothetical protein